MPQLGSRACFRSARRQTTRLVTPKRVLNSATHAFSRASFSVLDGDGMRFPRRVHLRAVGRLAVHDVDVVDLMPPGLLVDVDDHDALLPRGVAAVRRDARSHERGLVRVAIWPAQAADAVERVRHLTVAGLTRERFAQGAVTVAVDHAGPEV